MSNIHATEREIAAGSAQWLHDYCQKHHLVITEVTVETQARSQKADGSQTIRYGDVILWRDRRRNRAAVLLELKNPQAKADSHVTLLERANAFGVPFVVAWNFQQLEIFAVIGDELRSIHRQNSSVLKDLNNWTRPANRNAIYSTLETLCRELDRLLNNQPFQTYKPDRHYFVEYVRASVQHLAQIVEQELRRAQQNQIDISKLAEGYLLETLSGLREDMNQVLALQIVYRLLVKLMFYQAMQRHIPGLEAIELEDESRATTKSSLRLGQRIRAAFQAAARYGPAVIFADDPFDEHELSAETEAELETFIRALKLYDFENMAEDVVGRLFENIIEPDLRHRLGQYYTPEDLVDLTIALTVNDMEGPFMDPTCGSGIFLLRIYNLLQDRMGELYDHAARLKRIWGIEIGRFPASLAALNLTRQNLHNFREIAQIIHADFFDVELIDELEAAAILPSIRDKRVPRMRAILGNMPFVRHELIERSAGNYKNKLLQTLAEALLFTDAYLFKLAGDAPEHVAYVAQQDKTRRRTWIKGLIQSGKLTFALPGTADIFVYILLRLGTMLQSDGRLGIISSNAWLDTKYGYLLQKYILRRFHLETIVASWVEPWFEDAAINTVILVLQRRIDRVEPQERSKFVTLQQSLKQLLPTRDLNTFTSKRWNEAYAVRHTIERVSAKSVQQTQNDSAAENEVEATSNHKYIKPICSSANQQMQVRSVTRSQLEKDLEDAETPARWSRYLRAPDIYFDIIDSCREKLTFLKNKADIRPGIKSGINDFFYLRYISGYAKAGPNDPVLLEASDGAVYSIERRFVRPIIKSPRELLQIDSGPNFGFKYCAFICDTNKETLLRQGYIGAAEYLDKTETRTTKAGVLWKDVTSVKGRKQWWSLKPPAPSDLLLPMSNNKRFAVFIAPADTLVDHNLFECTIREAEYRQSAVAFCNSIVFTLFREVHSRVNLGDGASKTELIDWKHMLVPRAAMEITESMTRFYQRRVKPIDQEVISKDRRALDEHILRSLGLDPVIYLDQIVAGITHMVNDRIRPAMQRTTRKRAVKRLALDDIRTQVLKSVFPRGPRRFPQDFMPTPPPLATEIYLPPGELHVESMLGQHSIQDVHGNVIHTTFSASQALYILLCAQCANARIILPQDELVGEQLLREYRRYYQAVKKQVFDAAMQRLHDKNAAIRMTRAILDELNFQDVPQLKTPY